ncbi:unnamed protein product [Periconia digitata]|uniref:AA1-like domain-containing protein n=1 Tax=Periconia digitata TaxID=1303443 RepID=A0A9W4UAJ3_9PLEO|nr:unnamed protein product [Periconia digitata]
MQFIVPSLLLPLALAAPSLVSRDDANSTAPDASALTPWQITSLNTHSPSGRPGNDPHSTLNFSIADTASTAKCSAQWIQSEGVPSGEEQVCETESGEGSWSFEFIGDSGRASSFEMSVKLVDAEGKTFVAEGPFATGGALSGQCGGSGVCNWSLKDAPFEFQQSEQ